MILVQKFRKSTSSGTSLSKGIPCTRIFTPLIKPSDYYRHSTIINWGLSDIPWLHKWSWAILNHPESVKRSSNKLLSFESFSNYGLSSYLPPYTTIKSTAQSWANDGKVVCRKILCGSSGNGIVITGKGEEVVDAPLYTLYIEKKWEFRYHIVSGKVIHSQQKRRLTTEELEKRGIASRNKYIRNTINGYIFSNILDINLDVQNRMEALAIKAINSLSLDFGAVDLIVTKDEKIYLLEVNSAPGLEGTTLDKYIIAFR